MQVLRSPAELSEWSETDRRQAGMGQSLPATSGRQFSGVVTGYVMSYLASCPEGTIARVFA